MTNPRMPWTPDIEINAALVERVVSAQFPEFKGQAPVKIGEGWDNCVWRIGDTLFRFPHREVGLKFLTSEMAVMPWLGPLLPLPVPIPIHVGEASEAFPRPFFGYRFVPGRSADECELTPEIRAKIAPQLGRFLGMLHQQDADHAESLGANGVSRLGNKEAWLKHTFKRVPHLEGTRMAWAIDLALPFLEDVRVPDPATNRFVCHGDLYFRHITLDQQGALAGVIDWGDVGVHDRCSDLEMIYGFFPPSARASFLHAYHDAGGPHIDDLTLQGARAIAASTLLHLGAYGLDIGDELILKELEASGRWIAEN